MSYTTRRGRREDPRPAESIYGLPYEEADDDGRIIVAGGNCPVCPDCGSGHLQWAEAGYVPWHRICDVCGSHWSLHPVRYIRWGADAPWTGTDDTGLIRDVDQMDPDPRLPEGVTHRMLLEYARKHGTEPNGDREDQQVGAACWAQRARFY